MLTLGPEAGSPPGDLARLLRELRAGRGSAEAIAASYPGLDVGALDERLRWWNATHERHLVMDIGPVDRRVHARLRVPAPQIEALYRGLEHLRVQDTRNVWLPRETLAQGEAPGRRRL